MSVAGLLGCFAEGLTVKGRVGFVRYVHFFLVFG